MERKIHNRKSAVFQSPQGDIGKSSGHQLQGGLDVPGQNDPLCSNADIGSPHPVKGNLGRGYSVSDRLIFNIARSVYGLIYLYSGMDKLLGLEEFRTQLKGVPIVRGIAPVIAPALPILELCLSSILLFAFGRYERIGLWCSVVLMGTFTIYITIMMVTGMHHSQCSCSGLIGSLNWTEHLIFNLVLVGLGISALAMESKRKVKL
ncbi:MauE/DoxX family redox-associated membrane protein [Sphingobacterium sp. CZ-2]|uniref:MauE/DoxX family redox-associated membrane protein n=1 Tax=Sphingobacterium sp. CZ-2 TaxID=2557994 RepID=UPI00106FEB74|nr:MauE/DoxX family redox-associated membrane protein [Sphingobacterium sp. CZ-2]QBR13543.1 hypothetical protein E3D81_15705 [Sphingobacterium sp. CZ-2]